MEERRGERTKVRNHPAYDLNERTRPERLVPMAVAAVVLAVRDADHR